MEHLHADFMDTNGFLFVCLFLTLAFKVVPNHIIYAIFSNLGFL